MLVNSTNLYSNSSFKNPAFGSVVLSRVVLRRTNQTGAVEYASLKNYERGIVGIYQSLSRRVQSGKAKNIIDKLSRVIPDFDAAKPLIYSTIIGVRSGVKRFLLTGVDAKYINDCGHDLIGNLGSKEKYNEFVKGVVLNYKNRVINKNGREIGIDIIVEGPYRGRKLVDIDVVDLQALDKPKVNNVEQILPNNDAKLKQSEFSFLKEIKPKNIYYTN